MRFGIPAKSMDMITESLSRFQEIKEVGVFGSRAIGSYKNGSDIDLVIYGSAVTDKIINQLRILLNEELPLPYYFDIVHYETLSTDSLKKHIDEYARVFYANE